MTFYRPRPAATTVTTAATTATTMAAPLCLAALLTLTGMTPVRAESLPLWEAGLGIGALGLPDYRGADQSRAYVLPVPYLVYRGERFKADRNGIRGLLFDSDRVNLNLSLNATLPVNSRHNDARRGMDDLKPAVEVGPTLDITLWRSAGDDVKLDFRAPLRTALTIESSPRSIGWLFSPNLNLDIRNPAGWRGGNLGLLTGPIFTTRKYNDYFYSVHAADVTAARPAYQASGGYAGSQFTVALSKRYPRYWVGSFLRYDTLAGATFENSPLVRQRNGVSVGIAIAWVFGQSTTLVNAGDADR